MSNKKKPIRLITNRNFSDPKSFEAIELDGDLLIWKASEDSMEARFPVTLQFVQDFYKEMGRNFDVTKLANYTDIVVNPYGSIGKQRFHEVYERHEIIEPSLFIKFYNRVKKFLTNLFSSV